MSSAADQATSTSTRVDGPTDHDGGPGRLTIADRVIEKIAGQAADEVDRAGGSIRRVLGVPLGGPSAGPPRVHASIDGDAAMVSIDLSVTWPAPVREVATQVRQRISDRLAELAGVRRTQVDIRVVSLVDPVPQRRVG